MTIDPVGRGRSESPVGNTIHNLVHTLSVKLDSAHRYGLYQDDAVQEGHEDCAQVFADIAQQEREMIDRLVRCLQDRIGEASTAAGGALAGGAMGALGQEATPGVGAQDVPAVPPDLGPGPSAETLEPGVDTDLPPTTPPAEPLEPGAETGLAPTAPGAEPLEPGVDTDLPPTTPPAEPLEPGPESDVPPTAPGGPGAEPRGPDTPRTP